MSETDNLFLRASREGFRYPSVKGSITTEQLWDLPLTSKNGFSLDDVAKAVNHELKTTAEESFVETASNPRRGLLTAQLEVVKAVITTKQAENLERANKAARQAERARLLEVLDTKKDDELKGLSREEIERRIAALSG